MQVKIMLYYICSTSVSLIDADYVNVIHLNTLHSKWKQSDSISNIYVRTILYYFQCLACQKFASVKGNFHNMYVQKYLLLHFKTFDSVVTGWGWVFKNSAVN